MGRRSRRGRTDGRASSSRSGRHRPRQNQVQDIVSSSITGEELSKHGVRPLWQKVAGVFLMAAGVVLVIVNAASEPSGSREALAVLPGGYSLLYVPLGIGITAWGGWWTGAFDRK